MNTILTLGLLLALKHFWADGPLQMPYMYQNKGKLGHPGGIAHAFVHGGFTAMALLVTAPQFVWLAVADFVAHYFIDLLKVKATQTFRWSRMIEPSNIVDRERPGGLLITSDWYFYALIADQCLHFATYVAIIWAVVR